jgi:hypothetical protein
MPTEHRFEDLDLREEPSRGVGEKGTGVTFDTCQTNRCPTNFTCSCACCTVDC